MRTYLLIILFAIAKLELNFAREYEVCELVDELYNKYDVPRDEIYKHLCIVKETTHEEYGIYRIKYYWCAEYDGICNASCDDFVDDDIADDVECATLVLQHEGIDAWLLSDRNCEGYKKEVDTCLERVEETSKSFGNSYDIDEYGDFMNHTHYASSAVATTNSFLGTHFTILSFALFSCIKIF
ncbi:CLUMA_CG015387, isoform A [Clunio marinus]|uniref:lysozyme n=1 Tax=Clunio marinus TaxID=568069 RepID=A0A1J1INX4_9DIPT|nr:CLUMA_CG015387, isoform A [Clunio marinus]